jgi:hypothetical protein
MRSPKLMTELFADIQPDPPRRRLGRDAPWLRRALLAVFALLVVAVLAGAIGQAPVRSTTVAPAARLVLSAPNRLRGGLLFQARIDVHAHTRIANPQLTLGPGWFEGMQVNTIEPQPSQESGSGDRVTLSYDTIDAGETLTVWLQFQVDPINVGRRNADVRLLDGTRTLAIVSHSLTILP